MRSVCVCFLCVTVRSVCVITKAQTKRTSKGQIIMTCVLWCSRGFMTSVLWYDD